MKNLMIAMVGMFALAAGAAHLGTGSAEAATRTAKPASVAIPPVVHGTPAQCQPNYQACTDECKTLVGNAKGACLRMCRAEYNECLAS